MDEKIKRKVEHYLDYSNPVFMINSALHRLPAITENDTHGTGWPDTTYIDIPSFLSMVVKMQFKSTDITKSKDVILSNVAANSVSLQAYCQNLYEIMGGIIRKFTEDSNSDMVFKKAIGKANLKEVAKQQLLSCSPLFGHNLAKGGHFVHSSAPSGFDMSIDFSFEAGVKMRNLFGTVRKMEFTVPASSSQGLVLKSKRDTPQFRVYSKALQAELAARCLTRKDYDEGIEFLNEPFVSRGYHGPANDFYLGLRKQGSRKGETVSSASSFDPSGDYDLGTTEGLQGRARGIFPPSEFLKIYFKPFAEGIKSTLFKYCSCTIVNLNYISLKVHALAYLSHKYDMFDDEGSYLLFYDLAAMDTTTHGGFFDCYKAFCEGIFTDFKIKEGDLTYTCGIMFPATIESDLFLRQDVRGRSTLSGQPDVTTKNNVCHILAMSWCIGKVLEQDPLSVFEVLLKGNMLLKNGVCPIVHIHGDDTMMYFSPNKSDMLLYYRYLAELGFETSYEDAPVFLKKTVAIDDFSSIDNFDADLFSNIIQQGYDLCISESLPEDFLPLINSMVSFSNKDNLSSEYAIKYNGSLRPIPGSYVKNRHGEYAITDSILLVMALSDTARTMGEDVDITIKQYWKFLFASSIIKDADLNYLLDLDDLSFYTEIISISFVDVLKSKILELAKTSISKADAIKSALERLYYSGGERFDDTSIETIFGSLFITNVEMSDAFDLRSMSTSDVKALIKLNQDYILDTNGTCPDVEEHIIQAANKLLVRL